MRRLYDGSQPGQIIFAAPAFGDVADRGRYQNPVRPIERAQHDLDGELASILTAPVKLDTGADLLGQSFGCGSKPVRDQALCEAVRDNLCHLLSDEFIPAVPELLFGLNIQQDDFAFLVHNHHGVRRSFQ